MYFVSSGFVLVLSRCILNIVLFYVYVFLEFCNCAKSKLRTPWCSWCLGWIPRCNSGHGESFVIAMNIFKTFNRIWIKATSPQASVLTELYLLLSMGQFLPFFTFNVGAPKVLSFPPFCYLLMMS